MCSTVSTGRAELDWGPGCQLYRDALPCSVAMTIVLAVASWESSITGLVAVKGLL